MKYNSIKNANNEYSLIDLCHNYLIMKYFSVIISLLIFIGIYESKSESRSVTVGISETLGIHGGVTINLKRDISTNRDHYFVALGTTIFFLGGAGFGWKHYFSSSRVAPYITLAAFGTYVLPMCGKSSGCGLPLSANISGSVGLDLTLFKSDWLNLHLQIGAMTIYNVIDLELFESPSDIPGLWPVINLKFGD